MQIRAVEFQENFRLVTLEAARQQSVVNRSPAEATLQAAGTAADQRLQDLQRPGESSEPESGRMIHEGERRSSTNRQQNSENRAEDDSDETTSDRSLPQGKTIDLFA